MAINTTSSVSSSTSLMKQYCDRNLLESAKTRLVFAKYGQKRPIPKNSGKRVEFRRWNLFDPKDAMDGLTEGQPPASQALSQTTVEAEVGQYGAYVEISDLLDMTAYDNVLSDSAELLGEQLGTVIEWITRDALVGGDNVQYAGGRTGRIGITSTDKLTVAEIRKAVRTLKRAKARPFNEDGRKPHFICICSPEATYDLQSDALWQDVSKYNGAEEIYSGELGRLFGVVFVDSTEAKVFTQTVHNQVNTTTASSTSFVLKNEPSDDEAEYLSTSGNKVFIGDTEYTVSSYAKATRTVTLSAAASLAANAYVYTKDAGALDAAKAGIDVHATLMFGRDAYGVVDVTGQGALQIIIKPHGSAGTADPLDQKATVGAKVAAYTAKILNQLWLLRIEHAVSA